MFEPMERTGLQDLHFWQDSDTGLQAIIAIHDTFRGPAIGGCRFISYPSVDAAVHDATRLAQGMSYKAALAGLPHGGGKSVIIKPDSLHDRAALMQAFGRFVDSLGGRYITAMDSGTQVVDMDNIARTTRYVSCTSKMGDPSPYTALGVLAGIQASVHFLDQRQDMKGIHVAIQGLGHVGYAVARLLHQRGARLTVTDIDPRRVQKACAECHATAVEPEAIYAVEADVFSPCGLGGVLNEDTIHQLACRCVAGSANNQLANDQCGQRLSDRGVLYAPDYLINAGGLIFVALQHANHHERVIRQKIDAIHESLLELYRHARRANLPTNQIADQRAEAILKQAARTRHQAA